MTLRSRFHNLGDSRRGPVTISFSDDLDDDPADWQFAQYEPSDRHAMAVAIRRGAVPDYEIRLLETIPLADPDAGSSP